MGKLETGDFNIDQNCLGSFQICPLQEKYMITNLHWLIVKWQEKNHRRKKIEQVIHLIKRRIGRYFAKMEIDLHLDNRSNQPCTCRPATTKELSLKLILQHTLSVARNVCVFSTITIEKLHLCPSIWNYRRMNMWFLSSEWGNGVWSILKGCRQDTEVVGEKKIGTLVIETISRDVPVFSSAPCAVAYILDRGVLSLLFAVAHPHLVSCQYPWAEWNHVINIEQNEKEKKQSSGVHHTTNLT